MPLFVYEARLESDDAQGRDECVFAVPTRFPGQLGLAATN